MYKRGDVVLCQVPMPSTSLRQFKLRPAVIVSTDINNLRLSDVMIAPCTSNVSRKNEPTQFLIEGDEIAIAGISVPSVVKCEAILTIPKSLITRQLGQLSNEGMKAIDTCLRNAFQL